MIALACLTLTALFVGQGGVAQAAPLGIAYYLSPIPPSNGEPARTHVKIIVSGVKNEEAVKFQMAVWSPGDYHVMNHGKYVRGVEAHTPGLKDSAENGVVIKAEKGFKAGPLKVDKPDENTWQVYRATGQPIASDVIEVEYDLPNTPPGFFSENVKVREDHAFYNGPATYMYVVGHKTDPVTLHIVLPKGWQKAVTPLDPLPAKESGTFSFAAPDYDTLADSPVVAGDYETRHFSFADRPHTLVFFGPHQGMNYDSFVPIYQKVVEEENRLMGGPPYKQYVFFIDVNGRGGGLEHLNSHRIAWGKNFPVRYVAGMMAHEFFHLWNVKRIRPAVLGPFDYVNPPRTGNLWFSEGVTEYFALLSVVRAGLANEAEFRDSLAEAISNLQSVAARRTVSAEDSSRKVWEANNSSGYGGLNYYLKGELIGLCLDLKLRGVTGNKASLDDVMRDMMARYGLPKPGFPEDGIREAVIRAGGASMGPFYDRLARSTEEVPFAECLQYAGLLLKDDGGRRLHIEADPSAAPQAVALRATWLKGK